MLLRELVLELVSKGQPDDEVQIEWLTVDEVHSAIEWQQPVKEVLASSGKVVVR